MKPVMKFQFDNTESVHKLAESMKDFGAVPVGDDKPLYKVGDEIVTNSTDTIKAGMVFSIEQIMENNGYLNYLYGGMWHKQSSFKAVESDDKVFVVTVLVGGKSKKWRIEHIYADDIDKAITLAYSLFGKFTNTVTKR
jgi:hypothetical protein